MDDNLSLPSSDRAIAGKTSSIEYSSKGSQVVDYMATEWTDEKHSLYLNSIEASFVNQLYSSEYRPNSLLGLLSRTQIHTNSSGSDPKTQSFRQFKVLRRGGWEKLKVERAKSQVHFKNISRRLSENPWVQHFRSQSIGKETHLISANQMNDNELTSPSIHLISQRHGREATSSRQPLPFYSQIQHQVFVGSITEVSDQNFVDMKVERGEELSRSSKKRARTAVSQIKDQVVPLVQTSDEKTAFLKANNDDCSSKNLENTGGSLQIEPEPSLFKDQEPNYPELRGR